ncbi:hypothetical protein DFJ73DRAFT_764161 [Zopfochytrium polystomum]|nr:hypothetical protein DFJ73DRAFT_764161 [Zopfochytrium polystomum]
MILRHEQIELAELYLPMDVHNFRIIFQLQGVAGTSFIDLLEKFYNINLLPETNSTPSGSVIAAASPTAPAAAPQLTTENVSPTSAFATAGTLTRQSTAPEGRSTTVVPTIPPVRGPRAQGAPPVSFMGANLAVAPVRFTRAEVRQQLQQQGAVANNRAVNQQYYSLQQRAAKYARVATEMRVRRDLEREEQRKRARRASARAAARHAGARNAAACRVATPAATPAPVMPVAAAPTSVVPAAVPTAVNAPGTTPMDVDRDATPVAEISPNRVITGDLERVVLNTKLQGIQEFKALAQQAPATTEVFARTFTPAPTPASLTPAATMPSTPADLDTVMVGTPASLPNRPVNTLAEVAQLNDMQWARFFNDMGTPTPEEIALSSVYSVPGNNALINALSDIFEGSASSPVTPTALAATAAAAAAATVSVPVPVSALPANTTEDISNTDKDTLESAIILAERFGSRPVSRSSSPHAEP